MSPQCKTGCTNVLRGTARVPPNLSSFQLFYGIKVTIPKKKKNMEYSPETVPKGETRTSAGRRPSRDFKSADISTSSAGRNTVCITSRPPRRHETHDGNELWLGSVRQTRAQGLHRSTRRATEFFPTQVPFHKNKQNTFL
jgi:hypothetical protein